MIHELPEDERRCPHDGKPMPFIRFETSKQLEYEPSKMKVIVHKRAVYACAHKHDQAKPVIAPKPPQPIDKKLSRPANMQITVRLRNKRQVRSSSHDLAQWLCARSDRITRLCYQP